MIHRYLRILMLILFCRDAFAQDTKTQFATTPSPVANRYAWTTNGLWVDSTVKFTKYKGTDTTKVLAVDANGYVYLQQVLTTDNLNSLDLQRVLENGNFSTESATVGNLFTIRNEGSANLYLYDSTLVDSGDVVGVIDFRSNTPTDQAIGRIQVMYTGDGDNENGSLQFSVGDNTTLPIILELTKDSISSRRVDNYSSDFSVNFNDRSKVDKGYVLNNFIKQGGDDRMNDTIGSLSKIYLRPKNITKVLLDSIGLNAQNLYVGDLTQFYRRGQIPSYMSVFGLDSTNPIYTVSPAIITSSIDFTTAPNPAYFYHGAEIHTEIGGANNQNWGDAAAHDAWEVLRLEMKSGAGNSGYMPRGTGVQITTGWNSSSSLYLGELSAMDVALNSNINLGHYAPFCARDFQYVDSSGVGLFITNGDKTAIPALGFYSIYDNIGVKLYNKGRVIFRGTDSTDDGLNRLQVEGNVIADSFKVRGMGQGVSTDSIPVWNPTTKLLYKYLPASSFTLWSDTTSILATQFDISTKWDIAGNSLNVAGTDKIGSTNSAAWTAVVNNVPVVSFNTTRTTQFGSNVLQSATNGAVIVARDSNTVTGSNIIIQNPSTGTNTGSDGLRLTMLGLNGSLVNRENGTLSLGANNTVSTTILANGNIGIGTVSPAVPLSVIGNASVGANLSATDFQWSPLGNERQLIFSGANGSNGYGDMVLASNNAAAAGQRLGLLLFGQIESGKSGSAPGLKAAISSLSTGSGGSNGGFGGTLQFMTRPDNSSSDPTSFVRMTIDQNGNLGVADATPASLLTVGSGDLFQVNSSGKVIVKNASFGSATLVGGTITVNTSLVTTNSIIILTPQNCINCGTPYISAKSAGTSFTITSNNPLDASAVGYWIVDTQ